MKHLLLLCLTLTLAIPSRAQLPPQTTPAQVAPAQPAASRELATLLNDIWQDKLKHEPEYATYLGDKRYDAELSDLSPRAINDSLSRGRGYIERLSAIDTTALNTAGQALRRTHAPLPHRRPGGRAVQRVGDARQPVLRPPG